MQSNILLFLEICEFWVLYIYTYTNFNEILINSWIYIHILFTLPLIFHNAIRLGYKSSTKSMKLVKMGQIRAFFFAKYTHFVRNDRFPRTVQIWKFTRKGKVWIFKCMIQSNDSLLTCSAISNISLFLSNFRDFPDFISSDFALLCDKLWDMRWIWVRYGDLDAGEVEGKVGLTGQRKGENYGK